MKMAKYISLECEEEDIEKLLDQVSKERTNEELIELEEEWVAEEKIKEAEREEEEEPEKKFTTKGLSEGLSLLKKLL